MPNKPLLTAAQIRSMTAEQIMAHDAESSFPSAQEIRNMTVNEILRATMGSKGLRERQELIAEREGQDFRRNDAAQAAARFSAGLLQGLLDQLSGTANLITGALGFVADKAGIDPEDLGVAQGFVKPVNRVPLIDVLERQSILFEANVADRSAQTVGQIASFVAPLRGAGNIAKMAGFSNVNRRLVEMMVGGAGGLGVLIQDAQENDVALTSKDFGSNLGIMAAGLTASMLTGGVTSALARRIAKQPIGRLAEEVSFEVGASAPFAAIRMAEEKDASPQRKAAIYAEELGGFLIGAALGGMRPGMTKPFSSKRQKAAAEIAVEVVEEAQLGADRPPTGSESPATTKLQVDLAKAARENMETPLTKPGNKREVPVTAEDLVEAVPGLTPEGAATAMKESLDLTGALAEKNRQMQLGFAAQISKDHHSETAYQLKHYSQSVIERKTWETKRAKKPKKELATLFVDEQTVNAIKLGQPDEYAKMAAIVEQDFAAFRKTQAEATQVAEPPAAKTAPAAPVEQPAAKPAKAAKRRGPTVTAKKKTKGKKAAGKKKTTTRKKSPLELTDAEVKENKAAKAEAAKAAREAKKAASEAKKAKAAPAKPVVIEAPKVPIGTKARRQLKGKKKGTLEHADAVIEILKERKDTRLRASRQPAAARAGTAKAKVKQAEEIQRQIDSWEAQRRTIIEGEKPATVSKKAPQKKKAAADQKSAVPQPTSTKKAPRATKKTKKAKVAKSEPVTAKATTKKAGPGRKKKPATVKKAAKKPATVPPTEPVAKLSGPDAEYVAKTFPVLEILRKGARAASKRMDEIKATVNKSGVTDTLSKEFAEESKKFQRADDRFRQLMDDPRIAAEVKARKAAGAGAKTKTGKSKPKGGAASARQAASPTVTKKAGKKKTTTTKKAAPARKRVSRQTRSNVLGMTQKERTAAIRSLPKEISKLEQEIKSGKASPRQVDQMKKRLAKAEEVLAEIQRVEKPARKKKVAPKRSRAEETAQAKKEIEAAAADVAHLLQKGQDPKGNYVPRDEGSTKGVREKSKEPAYESWNKPDTENLDKLEPDVEEVVKRRNNKKGPGPGTVAGVLPLLALGAAASTQLDDDDQKIVAPTLAAMFFLGGAKGFRAPRGKGGSGGRKMPIDGGATAYDQWVRRLAETEPTPKRVDSQTPKEVKANAKKAPSHGAQRDMRDKLSRVIEKLHDSKGNLLNVSLTDLTSQPITRVSDDLVEVIRNGERVLVKEKDLVHALRVIYKTVGDRLANDFGEGGKEFQKILQRAIAEGEREERMFSDRFKNVNHKMQWHRRLGGTITGRKLAPGRLLKRYPDEINARRIMLALYMRTQRTNLLNYRIKHIEDMVREGSLHKEHGKAFIATAKKDLAEAASYKLEDPNWEKIDALVTHHAQRSFGLTRTQLEELWGRKVSDEVVGYAEELRNFLDNEFAVLEQSFSGIGAPVQAYRGSFWPALYESYTFMPDGGRFSRLDPKFKARFEEASFYQRVKQEDMSYRSDLPEGYALEVLRNFDAEGSYHGNQGIAEIGSHNVGIAGLNQLNDAMVGISWDPAVMAARYFTPAFNNMIMRRHFGPTMGLATRLATQVAEDKGPHGHGYDMEEFLELADMAMGNANVPHPRGGVFRKGGLHILNEFSGAVTISSLGGSAFAQPTSWFRIIEHILPTVSSPNQLGYHIREMPNVVSKGLTDLHDSFMATLDQSSTLASIMPEYARRIVREEWGGQAASTRAARMGAQIMQEHQAALHQIDGVAPKLAIGFLKLFGTTITDRFGRNAAVLLGETYMESLMKQLVAAKRRGDKRWEKNVLDRGRELFGRDPEMFAEFAGGAWMRKPSSPQGRYNREFIKINGAQVIGDRSHGRSRPIDMPVNFDRPDFRHVYKLQTFVIRMQADSKRTIDPRDPASPLRTPEGALRLLAGLSATGFIGAHQLSKLRAEMRGQGDRYEETPMWQKVLENWSFMGWFPGVIDHASTLAGRYGPPKEAFFGPVGQMIYELGDAAFKSSHLAFDYATGTGDRRFLDPMWRFGLRKIPNTWIQPAVGLIPGVERLPTSRDYSLRKFPPPRSRGGPDDFDEGGGEDFGGDF